MKRWIHTQLPCWMMLLMVIAGLAGCGSAPQFEGNEDSLRAAEALWTAVCSQRQPLVEQSAAEIERLHKAGTLSDEAYTALNDVVASARASDWKDAVSDLKAILQGQRRKAA